MARNRTPAARALVEGRHLQHPERHKSRQVLSLPPLGAPPNWLKPPQVVAWDSLTAELPWLDRSHRALVEIATVVMARLRSGEEVGVNSLNLLRLCLSQMGATPVDAGKVSMPVNDDDNDGDDLDD